jgi:hypothetical protein
VNLQSTTCERWYIGHIKTDQWGENRMEINHQNSTCSESGQQWRRQYVWVKGDDVGQRKSKVESRTERTKAVWNLSFKDVHSMQIDMFYVGCLRFRRVTFCLLSAWWFSWPKAWKEGLPKPYSYKLLCLSMPYILFFKIESYIFYKCLLLYMCVISFLYISLRFFTRCHMMSHDFTILWSQTEIDV